MSFHSFVPHNSVDRLQSWIDDLDVEVKVTVPRKTKLGDFRAQGHMMSISINNNLNKYSFLITLTHELSHAFIFRKFGNLVKPHGSEWQLMFQSLMLNFLTPDYFPEDILSLLSSHMIKPKASTFTDIKLAAVLQSYDEFVPLRVSDLLIGDIFQLKNGKTFIKGKRLRKRYKCRDLVNNRSYLFHPFVEIIKK